MPRPPRQMVWPMGPPGAFARIRFTKAEIEASRSSKAVFAAATEDTYRGLLLSAWAERYARPPGPRMTLRKRQRGLSMMNELLKLDYGDLIRECLTSTSTLFQHSLHSGHPGEPCGSSPIPEYADIAWLENDCVLCRRVR